MPPYQPRSRALSFLGIALAMAGSIYITVSGYQVHQTLLNIGEPISTGSTWDVGTLGMVLGSSALILTLAYLSYVLRVSRESK